jgi:hypothetical protein
VAAQKGVRANRKSSITRLDPRIKLEVDSAIREGRATIDELVTLIRAHGGAASRSAVGRYVLSANKQMERYREAQALAKVWGDKLSENGDVAQLTRQLLSSLAFQTVSTLAEGEDVEGKEIMFLARTLRDIESSKKLGAEARAKVRAETAEQAAAVVGELAKKQGMSADQAEFWRKKVLGIAE